MHQKNDDEHIHVDWHEIDNAYHEGLGSALTKFSELINSADATKVNSLRLLSNRNMQNEINSNSDVHINKRSNALNSAGVKPSVRYTVVKPESN